MKSIYHSLEALNAFELFLEGIRAVHLADQLMLKGPYTLFVPTEQALSHTPLKLIHHFSDNTDSMKNFFLSFILPGRFMSHDLLQHRYIPNLVGDLVHIHQNGNQVENTNIIISDIQCSNGVIHIVDNLIFPRSVFEYSFSASNPI